MREGVKPQLPRLVTIPISHYCEKARWGLERAGIAYVEDPHGPILHMTATMPLRTRTVPVLVTRGATLTSSTDILRWADARTTKRHLYPTDPGARREVEELEAHFDAKLGPAARRWAYLHVLSDPRRACEIVSLGIPEAERKALVRLWPVASGMMRKGMNVTPEAAARSLERLRAIFGEVSVRLASRRFLVGDAFTAADLTFAALAVPVIAPPQYPWMPAVDSLPAPMRDVIRSLRATPAGAFVVRLYREERPRSFPAVA